MTWLAAIVPAAGLSSRMGEFKPFLSLGGETVLARSIGLFHAAADIVLDHFDLSHAGVIRSVLCRAADHPMDELFHFKPDHSMCTLLVPEQGALTLIATGVNPGDVASHL